MKKKILVLGLVGILLFSGCSSAISEEKQSQESQTVNKEESIITPTPTISPEEIAMQEKEKVLEIEREYYPEIREAISKLKNELKNPASLKIEECIVYNHILESEQINFSDIYFTYSAQNDLGNNITSYYLYDTSSKIGVSDVSTYDIAKNNAEGKDNNGNFNVEISKTHHTTQENPDLYERAFIVDLDDLEENG